MMLHTKSDRSRLLKLLALLPIVGIALAVNAEKVVDVRYEESQKGVAEKKAETAAAFTATLKYDTIPGETLTAVGTFEPVQGDVFDVVEEMPQYPGGKGWHSGTSHRDIRCGERWQYLTAHNSEVRRSPARCRGHSCHQCYAELDTRQAEW